MSEDWHGEAIRPAEEIVDLREENERLSESYDLLVKSENDLREENERLKEAYARLADRLRLATPKSLVEATEASIDLQARLSAAEQELDLWRRGQLSDKDRRRDDALATFHYGKHVLDPKTGEWRTEWREEGKK